MICQDEWPVRELPWQMKQSRQRHDISLGFGNSKQKFIARA
jgi:hypothetical protein